MLRYTAAVDDDELAARLEEGSAACSLALELEAEEADQDAGSTRIMHPPEEDRSGLFLPQLRPERKRRRLYSGHRRQGLPLAEEQTGKGRREADQLGWR